MQDFENIYFEWLKERISIVPNQPDLDEKAQKVMNLLTQLQ